MRILAWNIQWFTLSRVECSPQGSMEADFDDADRVVANGTYISSTVRQADPDVFVLLEARCTWNQTVGTLADGDGTIALQILLTSLRMVNRNWCLVPPLRINPSVIPTDLEARYTETIGVYYRSDRLTFTGPLRWPLNVARTAPSPTGPPIPPGGNVAASYPAPWDATLPPGTVAAPQTSFVKDGYEIYFTEAINRRPYLTTFTELGGMRRNVRLFSVHLPPKRVKSRQALSLMTTISNADSQPGNDELTVIVGDTNVNLNGNTLDQDTDSTLKLRGYIPVYPQSRRPSGRPRVYSPSVIRSRTKATFDDYKTGKACYDYGYVWYGPRARPQQRPNSGVVADRVAGVAAANGLPGFTHDMRVPLAELIGMSTADLRRIFGPNAQRSNIFRERWNYGHISRPDGTSDHLPFFLIV